MPESLQCWVGGMEQKKGKSSGLKVSVRSALVTWNLNFCHAWVIIFNLKTTVVQDTAFIPSPCPSHLSLVITAFYQAPHIAVLHLLKTITEDAETVTGLNNIQIAFRRVICYQDFYLNPTLESEIYFFPQQCPFLNSNLFCYYLVLPDKRGSTGTLQKLVITEVTNIGNMIQSERMMERESLKFQLDTK